MITAKEAREIFEMSEQMIDIHNKIIDAAENGRSYIRVVNPSVSVVEKLKELGYVVKFNTQPLDFTISW